MKINNDSNETSVYADNDNDLAPPFLTIMVGVTTAMTFMLNLPVIIIMVSRKCQRKKITNIHILSLSISDILTSVYVIPIYLSFTGQFVSYSDCFSRILVFLVVLIASVMHLFFICADRCWILSRWKTSISMRNSRIRFWFIIAAAWIISSAAISIPFVIHRRQIHLPYCSFSTLFEDRGRQILKHWSVLLLLVTIFICVSCAWMIWKLYRYTGKIHRPRNKVTNIQVIPMPLSSGPQQGTSNTTPSTKPEGGTAQHSKNISTKEKGNLYKPSTLQNRINLKHEEKKDRKWQHQFPVLTTFRGNPTLFLETTKPSTQRPFTLSMAPKHHRHAVITILILAILHVVSFTPFIVMILFLEGWCGTIIPRQTRHFAVYFTCINSAFNPIIYAFRIPEVRGCIKQWKEKCASYWQ